ncbi:hypothetical protein EGN72_03250 [Pseudorhodobacter sp. E13]|uniref:hypothetical protein n=1 Tax=Pseudorhodobacter sp. E13 TaxID=2487931 RepID=UPI000F8E0056|nr:hypothetical protein [Pseudorhodobacter sp. E13]RUS63673.1 hypothetical protein EGN72_03250 [Pseudorhodobacter sp. E13]
MRNRSARLTEITPEEMALLQAKADEMAELQALLNKLPMGLQIETLTETELERLRLIARSPATMLCGDSLLLWNNLCRQHTSLKPRT